MQLEIERAPMDQIEPPSPTKDKNMFVMVEDDELVIGLLRTIIKRLETNGLHGEIFTGFNEATQHIKTFRDQIFLVISDGNVQGEKIHGHEFLQILQKTFGEQIEYILHTGLGFSEGTMQNEKIGIMRKPVSAIALMNAIKEIHQQKNSPDSEDVLSSSTPSHIRIQQEGIA